MPYTTENNTSIPLIPVSKSNLEDSIKTKSEWVLNWIQNVEFTAEENQSCLVPDSDGSILMVLVGVNEKVTEEAGLAMWSLSTLAKNLPVGQYHLDCDWAEDKKLEACIGWGLGDYNFDFFKRMHLHLCEIW